MSSKFNFRSKKGMSLAVSLTICLFLILVTGGITTVAMLQHNETGSSMNTRQAYISAKGGLDTIQDALKNGDILVDDLPSASNPPQYYVFYYDDANELCYVTAQSEQEARDLVEQYAENYEIVGGEGTYVKIENKDGKFKVTALNTTGKFNGNVSMNRGELSFDAVVMTTYKFTLKPTEAPATEPPTEPPTPGPTTPLPNQPVSGQIGGRFMMVGQQTCLNETDSGDSSRPSTGKTLNQYTVDKAAGSNHPISDIYYIPYNRNEQSHNSVDLAYQYTYFPIVYDRMIKCTADVDRVSLAAVNEGIYMVGGMSGYKSVNEFYVPEWNQNDTLGTVSYISQNKEYQQTFACKFLVIENNFVALGEDSTRCPLVEYKGTEFILNPNEAYVVGYLPKDVTFYIISNDQWVGDQHKKVVKQFTRPAGYYLLKTGSGSLLLCNETTWGTRIADANGNVDTACDTSTGIDIEYWKNFNMYSTIKSYYSTDTNSVAGQIHSGSKETEVANRLEIIDESGKFILNSTESGHSSSSNFDYQTYRDNQHIFLSPNQAITSTGFYNWYCGRSFNFQWFRSFDLTVCNDAHVKISAPNVILTIGPSVDNVNGECETDPETGAILVDAEGKPLVKKIPVSNWIVGEGLDSSFQLFGNKGQGSPTTLEVMCGFNVKYKTTDANGTVVTKQYPIHSGTYTGIPVGLNLFSDAGAAYFSNSANRVSLDAATPTNVSNTSNATLSNNASVVPASITTPITPLAGILNNISSGLGLVPMSDVIIEDTGAIGGSENLSHIDTNIIVDGSLEHLYYDDNDSNPDVHTVSVGAASSCVITKKYGNEEYPYITFIAPANTDGKFVIPAEISGEQFDILAGNKIYARKDMTAAGANYEGVETVNEVQILKGYY